MNKRFIFTISLLLGVILTVIIYSSIGKILLPFREAPLYILLSYIFLVFLILAVHTLKWKIILKTTNHNIPFRKLFIFQIMGYSINYITPTAHIGGEPLKAAMLKENNVPYSEGVSSIFIDKSLEIISNGFFVFIGIMITILSFTLQRQEKINLIILSSICIILLVWAFIAFVKKGNTLHSIYKFLRLDRIKSFKNIDEDIKKTDDNINMFFRNHKLTFFISLLLSFSMWIFMFLEYKLLFLILGFNANIIQLFVVISFVGFAYMIPIPAAVGVLEAGQLSAFSILNLSSSLGIAASIIIRAKDSVITLIGLSIITFKGLWDFK